MMKKVFSVLLALIVLVSFPAAVSAEEYSTEYPGSYNSGSPLWLHCEISGMGEYLIVIDPNTNPQSFGFDSPTGYNLINNTGSAIYGRAYNLNTNEGYSAVWYSYYCLSLRTGTSTMGQASYEAYTITEIYGTTLDLIDYVGDRGNDLYKYDIENPWLIIIIAVVLIVLILVYQFHFKSRLMRL